MVKIMKAKSTPSLLNTFGTGSTYKLSLADPYDVIIIADDNALLFALEEQRRLFKDIPIVFLGVNNIDKAVQQNDNPQITGVVEAVSMKETIDLMLSLHPKTETVSIIVDGTTSSVGDLNTF